MVEKKKKSKRLTLHKKYKIEAKIKSHYRKIRRAARQNKAYISRKQAKDPGIPNSWPFKQEMLEEAYADKVKLNELQKQQREARREEQEKRRMAVDANSSDAVVVGEDRKLDKAAKKMPLDIAALAKDASKRNKAHAVKTQEDKEIEALSVGFNGIPGTTMQAYYREFRKVVDAADIILEVLDARDPLGCRCPDVERMIVTNYPNKKIVLVLNKIDLAPREVVENWLSYLRNEYPTIAFKSSRQNQRKLGQKATPVALASNQELQGATALGADTLLQLLKHYAKSGSVKTSVTVGIVGFPNVGKSSIINSLCRSRAVKVGATPGVTRSAQEVHLDKHVKLLDSPGIVFPKADDQSDDIILRHAVQIERVPDPIAPVESIVRKCNKNVLLRTYEIPDFSDAQEFLRHVAKAHGKVGKGGVADVMAAARRVIQDWVSGKIPFYTEAPAIDKNIHVAASVVTQFGKEFDLHQADDQILSALKSIDIYEGQALQANKTMPQTAPLFLYNSTNNSGGTSSSMMDEDGDDAASATMKDYDDLSIDDSDLDEDDGMEDVNIPTGPLPSTKATPKQTAAAKKKAAIVPVKQDLTDEADQYNPQVNQNQRKKAKQAKKKAAKANKTPAKKIHSKDDPDVYDFGTDFAPDAISDDDMEGDE